MGANSSSLVDCVLDGDIPALKGLLRDRPYDQQPRSSNVFKQRSGSSDDDDDELTDRDAVEWTRQVEEAVQTAVAMEIHSPRELQQHQIALELLLLACPAAWSSRLTGSSSQQSNGGPELVRGDDGQNNADWTASHRACVTGNLSFVAFVRQQQARAANDQALLDRGTRRDAFGLLPIDLVPPELLRSREETAADLVAANADAKQRSTLATTARGRHSAAIQWLRESKATFETRLVLKRLRQARRRRALAKTRAKVEAEANGEGNTEAAERTQQVEKASLNLYLEPATTASVPPGAFFVAFEPSQERFAFVKSNSGSGEAFTGHIHDREAPLRVRFRVPRAEIFLQGYFQLIWRAPGEPLSEEPRYEPQVLRLRDELQRRMDQNPPLDPEQLASTAGSRRLVDDEEESEDDELGLGSAREVTGWFPLLVAHIPEDSVVNVLFVACDRNLLHRSVVLSTEGALLQSPPVRDCCESSDYFDSSDDDSDEEEDQDDEEEEEEMEGYRFVVGGEEFRHPSVELDGKEFADVAELEAFVQNVCAARRELRDQADDAKQHDARPSEPTDSGDSGGRTDVEQPKSLQSNGEDGRDCRDGGEGPHQDRDASDAA